MRKKRNICNWLFIRIPLWFLGFSLLLVLLLKWVPIRYTPLMLRRAIQFRNEQTYHSKQDWVSLEGIAPELIQAVILTEDQRFWEHRGFDRKELRKMFQHLRFREGRLRGCSTLSQQTAKNLFTFGSRTWVRKAIEAYWTCLLEWIWGKERILEVYLNIAETGKGLYGVESACLCYFDSHAKDVSRAQAVSLAVCLPHPLTSTPYAPLPQDRARRIKLMQNSNRL